MRLLWTSRMRVSLTPSSRPESLPEASVQGSSNALDIAYPSFSADATTCRILRSPTSRSTGIYPLSFCQRAMTCRREHRPPESRSRKSRRGDLTDAAVYQIEFDALGRAAVDPLSRPAPHPGDSHAPAGRASQDDVRDAGSQGGDHPRAVLARDTHNAAPSGRRNRCRIGDSQLRTR